MSGTLLNGITPALVQSLLQHLNYKAELVRDPKGNPVVRFGMLGMSALVFFIDEADSNGNYKWIRLIFAMENKKIALFDANQFNLLGLLPKLTVHEGTTPVVECNVFVEGIDAQNIVYTIGAFEQASGALLAKL